MAAYSKINRDLWYDQAIEGLTDGGARAFLVMLINTNQSIVGAYRFRPRDLTQFIPQWNMDKADRHFQEVLGSGLVVYDEPNRLLVVPSHLEHDPIAGPKQVMAAYRALETLPQSQTLVTVIEHTIRATRKATRTPKNQSLLDRIEDELGEFLEEIKGVAP